MKNDTGEGLYIQLVDKRLIIVITQWKDSRILQTVSTIIRLEISIISRHVGSEIIKVKFPSDIIEHKTDMDGVDRGD